MNEMNDVQHFIFYNTVSFKVTVTNRTSFSLGRGHKWYGGPQGSLHKKGELHIKHCTLYK